MFEVLFDFGYMSKLERTTTFLSFQHNETFLILELKYLEDRRRIIVELYKTLINVSQYSILQLEQLCSTTDVIFLQTFDSIGTPCIVKFQDERKNLFKEIQVTWI